MVFVGISSVTLKIGLFHLLVTDCFMCRVVIVGRYKYKWLRRDSLRVCNEFPLLSYIFLTQQYSRALSVEILMLMGTKDQEIDWPVLLSLQLYPQLEERMMKLIDQ